MAIQNSNDARQDEPAWLELIGPNRRSALRQVNALGQQQWRSACVEHELLMQLVKDLRAVKRAIERLGRAAG